jgi:hypothetical protein
MKMSNRLHDIVDIPKGMQIGDLLPAFRGIKHEIVIGEPNRECASCGKPFNAVRKRRARVRLYDPQFFMPVAIQFCICGHCRKLYKFGGGAKGSILAGVQAYYYGNAGNEH